MKTSFRSLGWIHTVEYDEETTEFYAWFDSDQNNLELLMLSVICGQNQFYPKTLMKMGLEM